MNKKNAMGMLSRLVLGMSLVCACVSLQAQMVLESIYSEPPQGGDVVRLNFSSPLSQLPTMFTLHDPHRIALDFSKTASLIDRQPIVLNSPLLQSAQVIESLEKTRVLFQVSQASEASMQLQGNA